MTNHFPAGSNKQTPIKGEEAAEFREFKRKANDNWPHFTKLIESSQFINILKKFLVWFAVIVGGLTFMYDKIWELLK